MKASGSPVPVVSSISWRRPGILEISVSCKVAPGQLAPGRLLAIPVNGDVSMFLVERREEGVAPKTVTWVYRQGKQLPSVDQNDDGTYWSMDVSLMQVPITCHPNLRDIMSAGGGVLKNGEVDWPRYVKGRKNTWYGTTSFLVPAITVTKDQINSNAGGSNQLDFPQVDNVGYSVGSLQNGFSIGGGGQSNDRKPWLLESHSIRKIGVQHRETQVWRHGGVLGWADQLYTK